MKKYMLFLIIFICVAEICSYTNTISEDDVLRRIQKYDNTINAPIYDYQKDLAEWLSPENEYMFNSDDNSDSIIRIYDSTYIIKKERLYFTVRRDNNNV